MAFSVEPRTVFNTVHPIKTGPWAGIMVGALILASVWLEHRRSKSDKGPRLAMLLGVAAISTAFIVIGLLKLFQ
jgi:hypothetical protein